MITDRKTGEEVINRYSEDELVRFFLKFGSVEGVLNAYEGIPCSPAHYHRLILRRGLVKSPSGRPPVKMGSASDFFQAMVVEGMTIETFRSKPLEKIRPSESTLYRIIKSVRSNKCNYYATGLLVHPPNRDDLVLTGMDDCLNSLDLDHNFTIPLTYSSQKEDPYLSVLRTVQQELLCDLAVSGELAVGSPLTHTIIGIPRPCFRIQVLDVCVTLYELTLSTDLVDRVSSERLRDLDFESIHSIATSDPISSTYRAGIVEAAQNYLTLRNKDTIRQYAQLIHQSCLNQYLIAL